jgi:hypothetical protein
LSGRYAGAVPGRPADLTSPYRGHRFPPEVIAYAVWLHFRSAQVRSDCASRSPRRAARLLMWRLWRRARRSRAAQHRRLHQRWWASFEPLRAYITVFVDILRYRSAVGWSGNGNLRIGPCRRFAPGHLLEFHVAAGFRLRRVAALNTLGLGQAPSATASVYLSPLPQTRQPPLKALAGNRVRSASVIGPRSALVVVLAASRIDANAAANGRCASPIPAPALVLSAPSAVALSNMVCRWPWAALTASIARRIAASESALSVRPASLVRSRPAHTGYFGARRCEGVRPRCLAQPVAHFTERPGDRWLEAPFDPGSVDMLPRQQFDAVARGWRR